jgi:hypothetical protein
MWMIFYTKRYQLLQLNLTMLHYYQNGTIMSYLIVSPDMHKCTIIINYPTLTVITAIYFQFGIVRDIQNTSQRRNCIGIDTHMRIEEHNELKNLLKSLLIIFSRKELQTIKKNRFYG